MNKYLFFIAGILFITAQKAFCMAEAVSPELEQSLKAGSNEPNFMSIIFSLLVVVFLIYITGLIYSKLNIAGAKTVQEHMKNYDLSKVIVLSTTQLGQGKNLHVIELNNKRYLIGATQGSVNLIKELGEVKKETEKSAELSVDDAINVIYGEDNKEPKFSIEPPEEFDVHKKYL